LTAPHAPTPDDSTELSPHEQRLLVAIEDDLRAADPSFVQPFDTATGLQAQPRAIHDHRGLLIAVLLIILAVLLMPQSWHAVLGLLITFGLLPWLLLRTARLDPSSP
jgi:hypothetical protein